jgi:hypothetical protein
VNPLGRALPARTTPAALASVAVLGLTLAGCGGAAEVQAAPDAGDTACTALLERLPDTVLDRTRTDLAVTGAATWGDPAIVLRCGVPAPGPSSNCLEANGVDWIYSETKDVFRFVTHDRIPAVEVTVPTSVDRSAAPGALVDLVTAVKRMPTKADAVPCT